MKLAVRFEAGNGLHNPKMRTMCASIDSTQPASSPNDRTMNKRKTIKWGIVSLTVVFIAYFAWDLSATSQLESALEEARAQGVPLTMADLIEGRPEGGNAASHMYSEAISMCNAAGDVSELTNEYEPFGDEGKDKQFAEVPAELLAALPDFAEGIALLHRAGEMGECYFPIEAQESLDDRINNWDAIRTLDLSRLLVAAVKVHMDEGNLEGAKIAVQANLALTTAHRHEPTLPVQMAGIITANYGARSAMILAAQLDQPAEWLASLDLIEGTEPGSSTSLIARALASELPYFTQALGGGEDMTTKQLIELFDASDMELPDTWSLATETPYMRSAQASLIEYVAASIAIAEGPLHDAIGQADALANKVQEEGNSLVRAYAINASPLLQNYAACLAQTRLLLLGTKAYAHRAKTGSWPKDLESLGLEELHDPRTNIPFQLIQSGSTLTLVGDGRDSVEWVLD